MVEIRSGAGALRYRGTATVQELKARKQPIIIEAAPATPSPAGCERTSNGSAAWTYDAFGEVRSKSGTLSTSMLFTGEQFDAKARPTQGLYYLRARYYDPSVGRFLTRDPFGGFLITPKA